MKPTKAHRPSDNHFGENSPEGLKSRQFSLYPIIPSTVSYIKRLLFLLCMLATMAKVQGQAPPPGNPSDYISYWSFSDTNTWKNDLNRSPVSFTNLDVSLYGTGNSLLLDRTNAAWLQYNVFESDGSTNLTVNKGTVMFWFSPNWAGTNQGGSGPGQWGRLLEVGSYTTNASIGWWSLYLDPAGANIYFGSQTNGASQTHLSAPLAWTTNHWHMIALTYSSTNTSLYLDGALATNGLSIANLPNSTVLAGGFFIGSDSTGSIQAHGIFDDLSTYNVELDSSKIQTAFLTQGLNYFMNPFNPANFSTAPTTPVYGPSFQAIAGAGYVQWVASNTTSCVTSTNVWVTNMVSTLVGTNPTNQSYSYTFEIAGGSNNVPYDVFAMPILVGSSITNSQWVWMGQGYHCNSYSITNLPTRAFFVLGKPLDSDSDGLSDAYEQLVSKTDPNNADTDGDGIIDGWEVIQGLNPLLDDAAQPLGRINYGYDPSGWLRTVTEKRKETISLDSEGNILQATP